MDPTSRDAPSTGQLLDEWRAAERAKNAAIEALEEAKDTSDSISRVADATDQAARSARAALSAAEQSEQDAEKAKAVSEELADAADTAAERAARAHSEAKAQEELARERFHRRQRERHGEAGLDGDQPRMDGGAPPGGPDMLGGGLPEPEPG